MPTLTLTMDPRLSVPPTVSQCPSVAAMLDEVDEHDAYVKSESTDGESIIMLSDDERTVWYVVTIPSLAADGLDLQVDTFTLSGPAAFHIVNLDHRDGKGRVRCGCGNNTFTTGDPTDVDRFTGTFTCTVCATPWQTRNIVQRLRAVPAK